MSWRKSCRTCNKVPVAFTAVESCFGCWPSGHVITPPCLRCGSISGYFTNGLCGRCHPMGPQRVDSCLDCFAWGASRHRAWRCIGCQAWQQRRALGTCVCCRRPNLPVNFDGACRLCIKQRSRMLRNRTYPLPGLIETNQHGQQLFFADMFRLAGSKIAKRGRAQHRQTAQLADLPVGHCQLRLFHTNPDLEIRRRIGFPDPQDERIVDTMIHHVNSHAERYGWSATQRSCVRGGMRKLLSIQETPGAQIRFSEITQMAKIGYSVQAISAVLDGVGMLDDDRQPAIIVWFASLIGELPEQMRVELIVWFDVMRNGSSTTPRRKPRTDAATSNQFRMAAPVLRHWAASHDSLREISREDVKLILPQQGWKRTATLQALRSIFTILKSRQLVFANPTTRLTVPRTEQRAPEPIDLQKLRDAVHAEDPARAAVAALLAFHAIRTKDLTLIRVTDIHDGRLHLEHQSVLLAGLVRDCLAAYVDHRNQRWPRTANPHLFINTRTATHVRPVSDQWVNMTIGMKGDVIRRNRIADEAFATGGDLRLLTDMFGLSIGTAERYAEMANRSRLGVARPSKR